MVRVSCRWWIARTRRYGNSRRRGERRGAEHQWTITVKIELHSSLLTTCCPPAHHPRLLLIPFPLHFRSVIYSSMSVISVFSRWGSRRKEGQQDGGEKKTFKKPRGIGERSWRSAKQLAWWLAPGNSIWFGLRVGGVWGAGEAKGCSVVFDYRLACCCHKRMLATTRACLKGCFFN